MLDKIHKLYVNSTSLIYQLLIKLFKVHHTWYYNFLRRKKQENEKNLLVLKFFLSFPLFFSMYNDLETVPFKMKVS